jgi:hypothetical protein
MRGAWGIQTSFQQSVYPVLYVVIPDSFLLQNLFPTLAVAQVADAGGVQNVPIRFIPEPTSLPPLLIPTLLARRRR